jgi:hypothetical protein
MKKMLIAVGFLGLLSFEVERFVTVKLTEAQINYHWQNLQNIKAMADQSSLPHGQAKFIMAAIDSLQKDISLNGKLDSTGNKK